MYSNKKKIEVPIIILTAKNKEDEILQGLKLGADDYITKPFSPRQLVARVSAVLRRTGGENTSLGCVISFSDGDLIIDNLKHEVRKNGKAVNLTPSEYKLLMAFVNSPSKVYARDELISMALDEGFGEYGRIIDTHIKNIRHKIETNPRNPQFIWQMQ